MLRSLLLGLLLASTSSPGTQAQTVQEMLPACEAPGADGYDDADQLYDHGYCTGVAAGVSEVMKGNCQTAGHSGINPAGILSADTSGVTFGAMVQVWVNWARANPMQWGETFAVSMVHALQESFPCPS